MNALERISELTVQVEHLKERVEAYRAEREAARDAVDVERRRADTLQAQKDAMAEGMKSWQVAIDQRDALQARLAFEGDWSDLAKRLEEVTRERDEAHALKVPATTEGVLQAQMAASVAVARLARAEELLWECVYPMDEYQCRAAGCQPDCEHVRARAFLGIRYVPQQPDREPCPCGYENCLHPLRPPLAESAPAAEVKCECKTDTLDCPVHGAKPAAQPKVEQTCALCGGAGVISSLNRSHSIPCVMCRGVKP